MSVHALLRTYLADIQGQDPHAERPAGSPRHFPADNTEAQDGQRLPEGFQERPAAIFAPPSCEEERRFLGEHEEHLSGHLTHLDIVNAPQLVSITGLATMSAARNLSTPADGALIHFSLGARAMMSRGGMNP